MFDVNPDGYRSRLAVMAAEEETRGEFEELDRLRTIKTAAAEQLLKSRLGASFRSGLIGQIELDFDEEDCVVSFHCNYKELGLQPGVLISVTGSPKCLGAWDVTKSIPINEHGGLFIHISKTLLPFEFKFIIRKDDRILWQRGSNFAIGAKMPDRFHIYADMFMGEVTDAKKKPITYNDYSWNHYAWALTNKNSCQVTVEADHMYLDPSCRMRRLLDKAMAALDKALNPPRHSEEDLEPLRGRLRALVARIDALQPLLTSPEDLGALESLQRYVELSAGQPHGGEAGEAAFRVAAAQAAALIERARVSLNEAPVGLRAVRVGCAEGAAAGSRGGWAELAWAHGPAGAPPAYVVLKDGVPLATLPGSATGFRAEGLAVGATAALSVAARTPHGPAAGPVCATPAAEGPQLSAALAGPTSALLAWTVPAVAAGSGPVLSYDVEANGQKVGSVEAGAGKPGDGPLTFTAGGLRPGSTVVFRVVPVTKAGPGPASAPVPLHIGAAPPVRAGGSDAALGFRAVRVGSAPGAAAGAASGWAELAWSHGPHGAPAAYVVLKDGTPLAALGGSATSFRAEGLTVGAPAALALAVGSPQGPLAGPVVVTPVASEAPQLTAALSGATSALLAWSAPQGAAAPALSYDVEKDGEKIGSIDAAKAGEGPLTFAAAGLAPGATAVFRVVPVTKAGAGPASAPVPLFVGSTRPGPTSSSEAPVGLRAVQVGCAEGAAAGSRGGWAELAWAHGPAGAPPSYVVLKDGVPLATLPGSATGFRAEGLAVGATAALSVAARTPHGPAAGPVCATPAAEGPQLSAALAGPTSALPAWTVLAAAAGSGPVLSYDVEANGQKVGSVEAGAGKAGEGPLTFTAGGLRPGSTVVFRVIPVTKAGAGPASAPVPLYVSAALQAPASPAASSLAVAPADGEHGSPARPTMGAIRRSSLGTSDGELASPESSMDRGKALAISNEFRVLARLVPGKEAELAVLEAMLSNADALARLRGELAGLREREAALLRDLEAARATAAAASAAAAERCRALEAELAELLALLAAKENELEALRREVEGLRVRARRRPALPLCPGPSAEPAPRRGRGRRPHAPGQIAALKAKLAAAEARAAALERDLKAREGELLEVAREVAAIRDASTGISRDLDAMADRKLDVHARVCICGRQAPGGGPGQSPGSVNPAAGRRGGGGGSGGGHSFRSVASDDSAF
eukprot:tig00000882_g5262.t1